jgi:predicted CoA-binding protein
MAAQPNNPKKTLVVGASENPERYSYLATKLLVAHGHSVLCIGLKEGRIDDTPIVTGEPVLIDIHTITLYVNPTAQHALIPYLFSLNPRRIIFNPGTENEAFTMVAKQKGIETMDACTLVLLNTGQY